MKRINILILLSALLTLAPQQVFACTVIEPDYWLKMRFGKYAIKGSMDIITVYNGKTSFPTCGDFDTYFFSFNILYVLFIIIVILLIPVIYLLWKKFRSNN